MGGKGVGSHFAVVFWDLFDRGRPGERKVDSSPNRFAVVCCQTAFPIQLGQAS